MKTYSLEEVAEALGVGVETVRRWAKSGELRAINVSRNRNSRKQRLRVTDSDLNAFINARSVAPEARPTRRRRSLPPVPEYI